ncbi:hypothetical protein ACQR10_15345 [Bradyrhizobium sp. HKCCYLRH2060]|uniref:hypothetical protein n=1 Tax=Bradyrhizobium TaxID=374 RepID=UPI0028EFA9D6|nr:MULTISPECIES: hypothetical protein [unclassified Bradyrhizobium]
MTATALVMARSGPREPMAQIRATARWSLTIGQAIDVWETLGRSMPERQMDGLYSAAGNGRFSRQAPSTRGDRVAQAAFFRTPIGAFDAWSSAGQ